MEITEVKIKLVAKAEDKLLAFASVTFDRSFVVRDIKVIQGTKGLFVAMPSRKITDRCPKCGYKNHLQAKFCNQCGKRLPQGRSHMDGRGRAKLHADITHPINSQYRNRLQDAILEGFKVELEKSKQPDYIPPKDDDWDTPEPEEGSTKQKKQIKQRSAPANKTRESKGQPAPPKEKTPAENSPASPVPTVTAKPDALKSQDAPVESKSSAESNTPAKNDPPARSKDDPPSDDDGNGFGVFA